MNREIIQQLTSEMQEVFTESFEEVIKAKNYSEFNKSYASKTIPILLKALGKFYEHLDDYIRQSDWRIRNGYIVKDNIKKSILTSLGYIEYTKTIYKDSDGYTVCLLDDYVGLKPKERMMDDARERILEDVIDSSYRKAGMVASILDSVHKQTVKNLIMDTEIPKTINISKEKKVVDVLYIEADEDHVALQDKFKKKEYITDKNGKKRKKKNTIIDKLVYCFEGKELEAPISKRKRLINPHYFAGVYKGTLRPKRGRAVGDGKPRLREHVVLRCDLRIEIARQDSVVEHARIFDQRLELAAAQPLRGRQSVRRPILQLAQMPFGNKMQPIDREPSRAAPKRQPQRTVARHVAHLAVHLAVARKLHNIHGLRLHRRLRPDIETLHREPARFPLPANVLVEENVLRPLLSHPLPFRPELLWRRAPLPVMERAAVDASDRHRVAGSAGHYRHSY